MAKDNFLSKIRKQTEHLISNLNQAPDDSKNIKLSKPKIHLKLSKNALTVIKKRYILKNEKNEPVESPLEMFQRVAKNIAKAEKKYGKTQKQIDQLDDQFLQMLTNLEFLPNSPTFTGAGTELGQMSGCFVLPVEDSIASILKTQMDMGLIHKSGGGTGFSFSKLRPRNDVVGSTGGVASGPVSFMIMYNDTTEQIKQGGTRRGANMGILNINHPDIEQFIDCKKEEGKISNFNISVSLTDSFMEKLTKNLEIELVNPNTKKVVRKVSATELFEKIIKNAWANGEPGIIFIDNINKYNPTPQSGKLESTNPCGEQPLLPYESCNLGSINLARMIKKVNNEIKIDWQKLDQTTQLATRFLDLVIDANRYPIPEIDKMTKSNRKIGLGVMGFADLLYQLKIPYNSNDSIEIAEKIMKRVQDTSHETSSGLAKEKEEFPNFKNSIWDIPNAKKIRNAATTTIAPTGTLSIIANCSSGIEPNFALVYTKTVMDGTPLLNVNKYFKMALKNAGLYSEELMKKISEKGSIQEIDEIPDNLKRVFVVSSDIAPEWHIKIQAAFQKYTDNAVSKTINFPNSATKEDIKKAYELAYQLGCKGLTVYRDGSRAAQVLTKGDIKSEKAKESEALNAAVTTEIPNLKIKISPRKRPPVTSGKTYKMETGYGNLYVTINEDTQGDPFEVFASIGKGGSFYAAKAEAICRLISLALRSGIDSKEIVEQLKGIRGPNPIWSEKGMILSLPDAIGQVIERHIKEKNLQQLSLDDQPVQQDIYQNNFPQNGSKALANLGVIPDCPECGQPLEIGEGCLKCRSCGYSRCG